MKKFKDVSGNISEKIYYVTDKLKNNLYSILSDLLILFISGVNILSIILNKLFNDVFFIILFSIASLFFLYFYIRLMKNIKKRIQLNKNLKTIHFLIKCNDEMDTNEMIEYIKNNSF